jgi:dephospho-CoA kinase
MIIGVVGQIASGKSILVKYLTEKLDFTSFSLSAILHNELKEKKIKKFTRKTLQDMGNKLRREYGDDILARRVLGHLKRQKTANIVIEGIRNPGEIEFLKKNPNNFILIGVKARREIRFKRLFKRGKTWDPKSWSDFIKVDKRDLGAGQDKSGQQVAKCYDYCDYILTNNKDLKDFEKKVEKLFIHKLFSSQFVRK